jgi:hypothetical protein
VSVSAWIRVVTMMGWAGELLWVADRSHWFDMDFERD